MESVTVESYAGAEAEERPLRFYSGTRKVEVISIQERWLTPEGRCFKVSGDDGWLYILEYHIGRDIWSLLTVDRR